MTIYCLEENKTLTNVFAYNRFARIHETAKSSKIGFVRKLLPAKLNITVFCPVVDSEGFYGKLNLSSLTLHCHFHPLQAANCCRNSRLVVDEDDLMWVKN